MKDIIYGLFILFTVPSVIYFWFILIFLEKDKQIDLKKFDKK